MENFTFTPIQKELISTLSFQKNMDVNQNQELMAKLEQATHLGNIYRSKVSIFFHDDEGPKCVKTTIWATGTKFICLKGGSWIPISRITDVQFE